MGSNRGPKAASGRFDAFLGTFAAIGVIGVVLGLVLLSGGTQTDSERIVIDDLNAPETLPEKNTKDQDQRVVVEASPIVDELLDLIVKLESVNIGYGSDLFEQEEAFRTYIRSVTTPRGEDPVHEFYRSAWQEIAVSSNFNDLERAASELAFDLRERSASLADEEHGLTDSDDLAAGEILELHREHAKAWEQFADEFVMELGRWQQSWEQNLPTAREFDLHLLTALHDDEVQISATFTSFCRVLRSIDETVPLTATQLARVDAICVS